MFEAARNTNLRIWSVWLSQVTIKTAATEVLQIKFQRATTTGSIGAAVTPVPHDLGDIASVTTVRANDTTQGTSGTVLFVDHWNILSSYRWAALDERFTYKLSGGGRLSIELETAPAGATVMSGSVVFEEFV